MSRSFLSAICLSTLVSGTAWAQDRTDAVQDRRHVPTHEFTIWGGTLPVDAFTKGVTVSGAYTVHFSDLFAWEAVQFTYSFPFDTPLKGQLEALPQPVAPTPFEVTEFYGTSNFVFTPFYGKSTVMNDSLIRHEFSLLAGGGVGRMTLSTRAVANYGATFRLFAGKSVSFRLDTRHVMLIGPQDVQHELWLGLGIGLGVGG